MSDKIEGSEWGLFTFQMLSITDHEAVNEHFRLNFVNDSPIDVALGCTDAEFQYFTLRIGVILKQNLSFAAFHRKSGKLAAVFLNLRIRKGVDLGFPLPMQTDPRNLIIEDFFERISNKCENTIFEKYQVSAEYGEIGFASVGRDFRCQGLANEMYHRAVILFIDIGCLVLVSVNSSPFTKKICKEMNFKELVSWKFSDAKDQDGNTVVQDLSLDGTLVLTALRIANIEQ